MATRKRIPLRPQLAAKKQPVYRTARQSKLPLPPAAGYTVLDRIKRYHTTNRLDPAFVERQDKQAIGKLVRDAFFSQPKRYAGKREVVEADGTYTVLVYPQFFAKQIDAIIKQYYAIKP